MFQKLGLIAQPNGRADRNPGVRHHWSAVGTAANDMRKKETR